MLSFPIETQDVVCDVVIKFLNGVQAIRLSGRILKVENPLPSTLP
jgi:hypothetical protein